ncbi:hypothetical protein [Holophaga foetida]|uniref:hypothetical protein n=1 Tax=Holophaga foetida TaxID=35839 RepID=UPI0011DD00A5|nr:hypothetical protein [Holophaga foetida]
MSELKIRIELNKGGVGMPLEKLVVRADHLVRFLNAVVADLGLQKGQAAWLAEDFANGSVDFDCRLSGEISPQVVDDTRSLLDSFFGNKPPEPLLALKVTPGTKGQFRRLTSNLDPNELIRVSLYQPSNGELGPWLLVSDSSSSLLDEEPRLGRTYYGEVQGTVAALFKEGKLHLWVRDLSTDRRVRCSFAPDLYPEAVRALNDPGAVVFIDGQVTEDPDTGDTVEIQAEHIRPAPQFSLDLFNSMLGAIPDYTDPMTTLEHTEVFRDR